MFIPPYACWLTRMFTLALLILGSLMHRLAVVLHIWIMANTVAGVWLKHSLQDKSACQYIGNLHGSGAAVAQKHRLLHRPG